MNKSNKSKVRNLTEEEIRALPDPPNNGRWDGTISDISEDQPPFSKLLEQAKQKNELNLNKGKKKK